MLSCCFALKIHEGNIRFAHKSVASNLYRLLFNQILYENICMHIHPHIHGASVLCIKETKGKELWCFYCGRKHEVAFLYAFYWLASCSAICFMYRNNHTIMNDVEYRVILHSSSSLDTVVNPVSPPHYFNEMHRIRTWFTDWLNLKTTSTAFSS